MQQQVWVRTFRAQNAKNTLLPLSPRIRTSHGGIKKFESEVGEDPPPLPRNETLVRTWDFEFWGAKNCLKSRNFTIILRMVLN